MADAIRKINLQNGINNPWLSSKHSEAVIHD
jgi:hypothetical protein